MMLKRKLKNVAEHALTYAECVRLRMIQEWMLNAEGLIGLMT